MEFELEGIPSASGDQSQLLLLDEIYATTLVAGLTRKGECAICGKRGVNVTEHEPSGFRAFCAECSFCNICRAEDRPLGKHYGVASCGRCAKCFEEDNRKLIRLWAQSSGLIREGERKTFRGRCDNPRHEGKCSIHPEKEKKNCKHCLFRRCRAAGMRVVSVAGAKIYHSSTKGDGSSLPLTCEECHQPIVGLLYKCFDCHCDVKVDFNLCGECERRQAHAHHALMRFEMAVGEKVKELGESVIRRRRPKPSQAQKAEGRREDAEASQRKPNEDLEDGEEEEERRKVMRIAAELSEYEEEREQMNPCLQGVINLSKKECCNSVSKLSHVLTLLSNLREPSSCLRTCLQGEQQPQSLEQQCSAAAASEVENSIQRVTEILSSLQLCCGCCSCSPAQK